MAELWPVEIMRFQTMLCHSSGVRRDQEASEKIRVDAVILF